MEIKNFLFLFFCGVSILALLVGMLGGEPDIFGELYYHDNAGQVIVIDATEVYYPINMMYAGFLSGVSYFDNTLVINRNHIYEVDYSVSFSGGPGSIYHIDVSVNGLPTDKCHAHRQLGSGGDVGNAGSTCLLYLYPGDVLTLAIEDEQNPASNVRVYAASFNINLV